jgi:hypothetical protein
MSRYTFRQWVDILFVYGSLFFAFGYLLLIFLVLGGY